MATGKSSNLGASSSSASRKTVKQEEKRKQCATRAEEAKKPRPFQLINVTAHPRGSGSGSGTAVPVVVPPLHCAASSNNMATTTAFPFPMAGVHGAAQLWSTAATLGAASSRAAALTLSSLPATASADGPAAAPFVLAPAPPGLQPPPPGAAAASTAAAAAAAALALPVASAATGVVRPPLVLAQQAGAEGQLVPLPLHFVGYYHHTTGGVASALPAPDVGIPLAAALDKIENGSLGRMLSALMPACRPPLRQHQSKKGGAPPPWWPTGSEDWWVPELLAHLDTVAALMMHPHAPAAATPVPFAPSYSLKKAQKVALLVAIVKHLAPDFARIAAAVRHSGKLSVSETDLWHSALNNERAKCMRPVFVLLPQAQPEPQQQGGGGGGSAGTPSAAGTGSVVVVHSGSAASDGCEKVAIANLPAGACASVSAPAADVSRGEAIAAAELVEKEPQRSDIDGGGGVVSASDAPAGDGRDQRPFNFPAGDGDGSTHNMQGAAVAAAAPAGHVRQVVAGGAPEMKTMQPEPEQHGGVPGDDDVAAAAEDDQVQAHPVVDVEEGHQWWHNSEELNLMFAEFESFGDDVWY